jgi:hypothetical protein
MRGAINGYDSHIDVGVLERFLDEVVGVDRREERDSHLDLSGHIKREDTPGGRVREGRLRHRRRTGGGAHPVVDRGIVDRDKALPAGNSAAAGREQQSVRYMVYLTTRRQSIRLSINKSAGPRRGGNWVYRDGKAGSNRLKDLGREKRFDLLPKDRPGARKGVSIQPGVYVGRHDGQGNSRRSKWRECGDSMDDGGAEYCHSSEPGRKSHPAYRKQRVMILRAEAMSRCEKTMGA